MRFSEALYCATESSGPHFPSATPARQTNDVSAGVASTGRSIEFKARNPPPIAAIRTSSIAKTIRRPRQKMLRRRPVPRVPGGPVPRDFAATFVVRGVALALAFPFGADLGSAFAPAAAPRVPGA